MRAQTSILNIEKFFCEWILFRLLKSFQNGRNLPVAFVTRPPKLLMWRHLGYICVTPFPWKLETPLKSFLFYTEIAFHSLVPHFSLWKCCTKQLYSVMLWKSFWNAFSFSLCWHYTNMPLGYTDPLNCCWFEDFLKSNGFYNLSTNGEDGKN